jgi:hypothetical protein
MVQNIQTFEVEQTEDAVVMIREIAESQAPPFG